MSTSTLSPGPLRGRRLGLASRVLAGLLGGYALAWGIAAAGTAAMFAAGVGFHDAEFLASLIAVLAFLVAFLWAVAARRAWVPWAVYVGGAAVLVPLASFVQSTQA